MSITYTPTTNFGSKDSLPSNDPNKVIKGAEFTTEFTAIQSAFGLAAPSSNPTFTGTATFDSVTANAVSLGDVTTSDLTVSGAFTSVGIDDNATSTTLTLNTLGGAEFGGGVSAANLQLPGAFPIIGCDSDKVIQVTGGGITVNGAFTSKGIDDNATSTAITIDANENVGIGYDSPSEPLDVAMVAGDSTKRIQTTYPAGSSGNPNFGWKFLWGGNAQSPEMGLVHGGSYADAGLYFDTMSGGSKVSAMRITSTGNVGIGASGPTNLLHVRGASTTQTASADSQLVLENNSDSGLTILSRNALSGHIYFGDSGDNDIGQITYNHSSNKMAFTTNASEAMAIDASGNVHLNTGGQLQIERPDGATSTNLYMQDGGAGGFAFDNVNGDGFEFKYNGADQMVIQGTTGNVSVGSHTAYNRLDIQGSPASALASAESQLALRNTNPNRATYFTFDQTGDLTVYNTGGSSGGGNTVFHQQTGEAMRIDSAGTLFVGKTSLSYGTDGLHVQQSGAIGGSRTDNPPVVWNRNGSNGDLVLYRRNNNTVGSVYCTTTATTYGTSSDVRLKRNIVDAPAGNIDDIKIRSFAWKIDGSQQKYGVVAQELFEVAPEAVTKGETEEDTWGVDYSKLVPMMIKEIQDLKAEVEALKNA